MSAARSLAPPCTVRLGKPDDLAWVVDCWTSNAPALRGLRTSERTARVRGLLARDGSRLLVAHVPGEPDSLLGWAAIEDGKPACIHYAYVRASGRRLGIARAMLGDIERDAVDYSHAAPKGVVVPRTWNLNPKRAT